MFAIFEKLFRFRIAAAASADTTPRKPELYSIVAPVWQTDGRNGVYRGLRGDAIAIVNNRDQAQTLRDVLNLADGGKPSRRLLDAIYLEEAALAEK